MMDIKVVRRLPKRSVFDRLGGRKYVENNQICTYWLAGKCNRNPCRFLHLDKSNPQPQALKRSAPVSNHASNGVKNKILQRNPSHISSKSTISPSTDDHSGIKSKSTCMNHMYINSKNVTDSSNGGLSSDNKNRGEMEVLVTKGAELGMGVIHKTHPKLCPYWVTGNCVQGDQCKDLHSWFSGSGFSLLTKLQGHKKAITGIVLQSGSDQLLSSSKDESVRIWDCHSGQCVNNVTLGSESECLITEGPWVFVGLKNCVKAWNFSTKTELVLNGPCGLISAMDVDLEDDNMLFVGVEDGSILVWKTSFESDCTEVFATLKGHSLAVISLVVAGNSMLYSGSKDNTIRAWDRKTLQCQHTLNGHTNFVTSLICWDRYLLSGSLDNSIKIWAATENGNLGVVYEVKEESGVLALCGIYDAAEDKPILLCSCKDNVVRLYDLPSFTERGRLFSKREILTISTGYSDLFFTGDATGELSVWRLGGEVQAEAY